MNQVKILRSGGIIFLVAFLTVLLSLFFLLTLNQSGLIAFTGGGWLVNSYNLIADRLGYSVLFFTPVLLGYFLFFALLKASLSRYKSEPEQMENIRFYSGGMDIFITLFFGIGVLFTAWGLQNALVSSIGGVSKTEAGQLGAWGILQRLVENGILIALWTTIVGGIGGYLMRVVRYFFLGKELGRCLNWRQEQEKHTFFEALESIRHHVERIEENINNTAP